MKRYILFAMILFLLNFSGSCFAMPLAQAIKFAKELSFTGDVLANLEAELINNADMQKAGFPVSDKKVHEIINQFLAEKTKKSEKEPEKEPEKKADFEFYFQGQLNVMQQLRQQAREFELKKQTENSMQLVQDLSKIYTDLTNKLEKRGGKEYFYAGDSLDYLLRLKGLKFSIGLYGEEFEVPIFLKNKLKNPTVHLVSHNQILSTCGFNAIANAYAIEQQVREGKKITSEEIRKIAEQFFLSFIEEQSIFKKLIGPKCVEEGYWDQLKIVVKEIIEKLSYDLFDLNFMHTEEKKLYVRTLETKEEAFSDLVNIEKN